jgi:hypothetical protein
MISSARASNVGGLLVRQREDLHAGRSNEADLRSLRRARAAFRRRWNFLVEEPRPGALARRLADRAPAGKYIISDRPMAEEEWTKERATLIDAEATGEAHASSKAQRPGSTTTNAGEREDAGEGQTLS